MSAAGRFRRVDAAALAFELKDEESVPPTLPAGVLEAKDSEGKTVLVTRAVRRKGDFYETPQATIEAIVPHLPLPTEPLILDAGSGTGAIARVFSARYKDAEIIGVERSQELVSISRGLELYNAEFIIGNFLKWGNTLAAPDLIVMNPPFSYGLEFVQRALQIVKRGGTVCALLRLAFLASGKRREFNRRHPADVWVLTRRPSFTGGGTDATDYGWFVWSPKSEGKVFLLTPEKSKKGGKDAKGKTPKAAPEAV